MSSNAPLKVVLALVTASVPLLVADEIAPRMADSPEAQRNRDLTLLGGTTSSSSPAEFAAAKVRVLKALLDALQARVTAIDARFREVAPDNQAAGRLNAEREALLKRKDEVGKMLTALAAELLEGPTRRQSQTGYKQRP